MTSGDWLGALPEEWERRKLKYAVQLVGERADVRPEGMPYIGLENIESRTGRLLQAQREEDSETPDGMSTVNLFRAGDLLFGKLRPYLAKGWLCEFDGACTTEALVLRPETIVDGAYLLKVLLSSEFIREVDTTTFGSKMPRAEWGSIGDLEIPLPPLAWQRLISSQLGEEAAIVDQLIVQKQRQLELLAEKRRTLITHAVNQGLDPNAPRRDSGIPWLGYVPRHWEMWRVGHLASVGNGSTPFRDNTDYWKDGSIPWLNSAATNDGIVVEAKQFVTERALAECHLPLVSPGSVLVAITGQGKTRGQAALLKIEATINQHTAYVTPQRGTIDSAFLHFWFVGHYDLLRSVSDDTGGTKGALTCEQIAGLRVAVPTRIEQLAIVEYLSSELAGIANLTQATTRTIALLQERRSALISAAVSGQPEMDLSVEQALVA